MVHMQAWPCNLGCPPLPDTAGGGHLNGKLGSAFARVGAEGADAALKIAVLSRPVGGAYWRQRCVELPSAVPALPLMCPTAYKVCTSSCAARHPREENSTYATVGSAPPMASISQGSAPQSANMCRNPNDTRSHSGSAQPGKSECQRKCLRSSARPLERGTLPSENEATSLFLSSSLDFGGGLSPGAEHRHRSGWYACEHYGS